MIRARLFPLFILAVLAALMLTACGGAAAPTAAPATSAPAAPIPVNTCATFMPLYAGLATREQAERLVKEHLQNPNEYAPGATSRYRVPSTSMQEPGYAPRRYWCGPVWIISNWLFELGLRKYGYDELAEQIRQDSLALVAAQGMREYYDPRDGTGRGAKEFAWSAALTLELIDRRTI